MLSGIFYGAMYGDTITSVLINVPREGASVITCIEGYQMTSRGGRARLWGSPPSVPLWATVAVLGLVFWARFW